jgi:hypothetical protein
VRRGSRVILRRALADSWFNGTTRDDCQWIDPTLAPRVNEEEQRTSSNGTHVQIETSSCSGLCRLGGTGVEVSRLYGKKYDVCFFFFAFKMSVRTDEDGGGKQQRNERFNECGMGSKEMPFCEAHAASHIPDGLITL